ncbi:MAG: YheU family protein [Deltaproteobacteria bacterium]|nr:YheU family protein [Deltaproteobacteria bacterium]
MTDEISENQALQIPHARLSPIALDRLIEDFVTRDGTDYGEREVRLEDKKAAVLRQLEQGEVIIVFDPVSESANIVPKDAAW